MEHQCSPFNWEFYSYEEEGMEELWFSLLCRTSELETKVASGKEQITKKEDELVHLKDFLSRAIKERDEAESKCKSIMLDILVLQQHCWTLEQKESHFVDQHFPNCFDTSHGNGNAIAGHANGDKETDLTPSVEKLVAGKPLPEKAKPLQAVMEPGPLLQTLLLAGSLLQWQHPPPRIDSIEIPPVVVSLPSTQSFLHQESCFGHKRSLPQSVDSVFNSNTNLKAGGLKMSFPVINSPVYCLGICYIWIYQYQV
ncbi:hypothetical protein TIFTF001_034424 [Ficus carica]|uniref:Uncharacterized protein n=1 Tax=Ficus carica TaxID=3494 RepID=A0AA88E3P3_FICCA|nr:hypothetical protein TIFTF001_034424 [Ficus carica]